MKKLLLFALLSMVALGGTIQKRAIATKDGGWLVSNTVIVKMKQPLADKSARPTLPGALFSKMQGLGEISTTRLFSSQEKSASGLDKLYEIEFSSDVSPYTVAENIKSSGEVEWAEPRFLYQTSFVPNDPSFSNQWGLSQVSAEAAWATTQGDTSVVIGIVDTGVQWDHPDLNGNIWHNWKEIAGNGIDDDGNGYIDDTIGWDFGGAAGTADSNPTEDKADHGTNVAGIADAVTNNGVGVAGMGYKCKIMAVKTARNDVRSSTGDALIYYGYEGIVYAVDNGAKIINCSWGGTTYSLYAKQIIDYAISKNVLVVCAAGNNNTSAPHYPSAYQGTLSVGATGTSDKRSSYSNYGYRLDVSAPGDDIYNTWMTNTYAYLSGTSMASPMVAGLAGLVKSRFPSYTASQIAEQIRATADNVDYLNPSYIHMMGRGRINAASAVNSSSAISLREYNIQFTDADLGNGDGVFQPGETVSLRMKFRNILNANSGFTVSLTSLTSNATVVNGTYVTPALNMSDSCDNNTQPLSFTVSATAGSNATAGFLLTYTCGSYSDYEYISAIVNPAYSWQSVISGTTASIWGVDYASSDVIWISTDSGYVKRSTDGGLTFQSAGFVGYGSYSIVGLSDQTALVATGPASGSGQILRTTDGGTTWNQVYTASGAWFDALAKTDANNLWALSDPIGGKFHIVKSSDAGLTWTVCSNLPTAASTLYGLNNSWYQVGSTIWFGVNSSTTSGANKVLRSTTGPDGPWTTVTTTQQGSGTMAFSSATGNGLVGFPSVANYLNKTTNGGTSYTSLATTIGAATGLDYIQGTSTAYAATSTGLYKSTNNGTNWTAESLPATASGIPYYIRLANGGVNGIIGGSGGMLLRKIPTGATQTLTLAAPAGGEKWTIGTQQNITWSSAQIATVKIDYSTDNGTTWIAVVANIPASPATYVWTVPNTPTNQALIRISDGSNTATFAQSAAAFSIASPSDVKDNLKSYSYELFQNYPNPFNPSTVIRFSLASRSQVSLVVYNQLGQRIATLLDGMQDTGVHEKVWNASAFPSGVYFYQLKTPDFTSVKKLMLVK